MADTDNEKATRRMTFRPRLSTLRTPSSEPFKVPESYNVHPEPLYQPLTEAEQKLVQEYSLDHPSGIAEQEIKPPIYSPTSSSTRAQDQKANHAAIQDLRRRSTALSQKPPNIVTWEGPDDSLNPKNWNRHKKWTTTVFVSLFSFMSPVTSSMIAPSLQKVAADLHVESGLQADLMLSIFILAFALGPLLFGPLSEIYGRVRTLQATNLFYLVFNLSCGFAQTPPQMWAFRFLSGLGGSAPSAIGGGVLSDCWSAEERGAAVAAYNLAPLLGPAVGPIVGGFIAEHISWRWVFWISSMGDACIQFIGVFCLQETYGPELLHRKAKKLRKETGNYSLHTEFEDQDTSLVMRLAHAIARPFRMFFTQPIIVFLSCYTSFMYGLTYLTYETFPRLWQHNYGESIGVSGLNYIALSIGFALGTQIIAPANDRIYAYLKKRSGGIGRPEFRCPVMLPGSFILVIGLFWYGWSAQNHLPWIMPDIGMVWYSTGTDICSQCITTYLVDSYTRYAASALAAAIVLRSLCGFGFPLFAPTMFARLGFGWGCSLLGLIAITFGIPAPFLLWKFGPYLRKRSTYAAG